MAGETQSQTVVDPYEALVAAPASSPSSSAPAPSVASTSDSQDFSDYEKIVGASPTPKPSAGLDPYEEIVAGPNPQSYKAVKELDTAEASPAKDPALENWLDSMGINDPKERALFNADKPQGERPPFALGLAGWIDSVANAVTGGRAGNTAQKLVQEGTYEPAPGEPSFMNAGIPLVPPQKGTGAQLAAGAANVPIGFANFLLSPGGIATVEGIGLLPKVAQTLTGIGFTVQQARDFFRAKTLQEKITTGVGAFLLGLGTAVHAKQKPIIAKPTPPTPTVEGGESNAVPIESTASVGAQPAGNESIGGPAEGGGVGPVEPRVEPAGEIDPYEAIVRREASGERPPTETSGLPPQVEEPIISAGATAAGEPRTEGGDNVAAVETPQDRKARLQYERKLIAELGRTQRAAGDELVAAVIKAGGLPSKKSQYWSGELAALFENNKAKRLFRQSAKAPDITATELTGFDFQTSGDLIAALEDRFRTGRKHYPLPWEIRDEESVFGFGPGAAAKGELEAAGRKPIRMVNADIDAEREARGAEPLMSAARRANPLTWDEAMARIDHTPQAPRILVDNLNSGKIKSVNRTEQAMLLHEEIRLRNEKAMEAERSVDPHTSEDERAVARGAFDALEARLDATERANREAGSASGAALQIRQMAALDDYTYAAMETRARNAKGTPLTLEESAKLQEQAAEIERLQGELAKFEDADAREKAMETLSNLMRDTFKESQAQVKAGKTIIDILHAQRDAAKQRIISKRGRLNANFDPTSLLDEAIIGASHIADGLKSLGDWSAAMVKDFGERIRPYLEDLFKQSKDYFDAHSKLAKRKAKTTPIEKIATAAKEQGEGGGLTNQMVFDLAREHVRSGVTGLDEVMSAVQQDLEPHFPGLTVREVRDMFSDYGKVKFPSQKADLVALRDYRRQAQLVSALEDAQRRVRPERSGQQRDQPSAEVLELQKQVKEEMQKAGFTAAPKPSQLKTNLDRFKTYLDNRITEANRRLAENDYSKPVRTKTLLDNDAIAKQAELGQLQRKIDSQMEKLRLKNRTGWEKFQDAAVKWKRTAVLLSPRVFPKLIEAGLVRIVTNPISRVLSQPLRVIPGLTEKAPAQLRIDLKAEADRVAGILGSPVEVVRKLVGKSTLDSLGKKRFLDSEMLNLVGNAHGAVKEPVRQGEYHAALRYYSEQARKEGLDIREPGVQASIVASAVADANWQTFQTDSAFSKYFVSVVQQALRAGKFTGARTLANAMQFLMPIVRVSSNIAVHSARLNPAIGFTEAGIRLATAFKRGELANRAAELSHEDAQHITRAFAAGALGTILAAYAWQNQQNFGGIHGESDATGKRPKSGGLQPNEINFVGLKLPGWMNHAPEMQLLNTVASARRVYDSYYRKGTGTVNSLTEAVAFSLLAPVKNLPFIDTWLRLFSGRQSAGQTFGQTIRSAIVPGGDSILGMFDKQQRSPRTFVDELKMSVPGLRQSVPVKRLSGSSAAVTPAGRSIIHQIKVRR